MEMSQLGETTANLLMFLTYPIRDIWAFSLMINTTQVFVFLSSVSYRKRVVFSLTHFGLLYEFAFSMLMHLVIYGSILTSYSF